MTTTRPRTMRGIGLALALCATAASAQDDPPQAEPSPKAPAGDVLAWTSPQGQPFWYRLPKKMSERDPVALVFMLHGTGMPWKWAFFNYPIANGQFRGDDIVVAPEGMTPGANDTFNFLQGPKDGEQIVALIELFKAQFPIDRVYLYGHSQGAFFCYWFAGEHPELVDGIVAHAGNVLDVRHSKLAKEKVAIGILHATADQVVPVDCAYRSEKIYRDEGYQKVKLEIVEGLGEHAGHWPLPDHAAQMFEWLDQVSVATPAQALGIALAELAKEGPSAAIVADAHAQASALLIKYRGDDEAELDARLALVGTWLADAAAAHAEAIAAAAAAAGDGAADAAWPAHFAAAHRAFAGREAWEDALKDVVKDAQKHDKQLDKAIGGLEKPSKSSFGKGVEALEEAWLAARWDELRAHLERIAADPPKGLKEGDVAALSALAAARAEPRAAGAKAAAELDAAWGKRVREAHPDLFADTTGG